MPRARRPLLPQQDIGFPVSADLLPRWGAAGRLEFGELTNIVVDGKRVQVVATAWPGRDHKTLTKAHVELLFCGLGLPTWE